MPRPQPASRPTAPTAGRTHFVVIGIQDDGSASIAIAIRPSATRRSRSAQRAEGRPPHSDSRGRAGPSAAPWWHLFGLQASRPCGEGHGGRSRSSPPPGSMQATRGHGRRSARSARPRWWCRRRRRAVRRRSIDVAVDLRDKRTRQSDRAPPSGALQPSSIISPEARRRRFTRTVATARASSRIASAEREQLALVTPPKSAGARGLDIDAGPPPQARGAPSRSRSAAQDGLHPAAHT